MLKSGVRPFPTWGEYFLWAFREMAPRLAAILPAHACREGWVQGELFRLKGRAPTSLMVNHRVITSSDGRRGKFDLSSDGPPEMIGEIKIIGTDYLRKNINGTSDFDKYVPDRVGQRMLVNLKTAKAHPREGSIIKDALRLWREKDVRERYLILIVPRSIATTDFARALEAVKFPGEEAEHLESEFKVRIWRFPKL